MILRIVSFTIILCEHIVSVEVHTGKLALKYGVKSRMFHLSNSVVGTPSKPCSSSLLRKFNPLPTVFGPFPDLLRNAMVYDKSLSSYDRERHEYSPKYGVSTIPNTE